MPFPFSLPRDATRHRFDRSLVNGRPLWASLAAVPVPILDRTGRPLLPLAPRAARSAYYVCVEDIDAFARALLPHLALVHPLSGLHAIDVGHLLDRGLRQLAIATGHQGVPGLLRSARRPVEGVRAQAATNRRAARTVWHAVWSPHLPPLSLSQAEQCVDAYRSLQPLALQQLIRLYGNGVTLRFGQVYTVALATADEEVQVRLLAEPRTVRDLRAFVHQYREGRHNGQHG